jgi:superfamily II DNA or RNA helicase
LIVFGFFNFRKKGGLLIATEMTLGRGFNAPEINCVCIFFPNKFDGRVKQMVGRALRKKEGKGTPYIIDWHDSALNSQYFARLKAYKELWGENIKIFFSKI